MSVDVRRYLVTDVEGRRVAAAVVARAALRFGLMRAAAVVLVLVVLLVAVVRHETAFLGLAAEVPIIAQVSPGCTLGVGLCYIQFTRAVPTGKGQTR